MDLNKFVPISMSIYPPSLEVTREKNIMMAWNMKTPTLIALFWLLLFTKVIASNTRSFHPVERTEIFKRY